MNDVRWVARLTPAVDVSIEDLLALSGGLDVWERHTDALVVAADEGHLAELEDRRLARVERLSTTAEYVRGHRGPPDDDEEGGS